MNRINFSENPDLISTIKNSDAQGLKNISESIREYIVKTVSKNGGHLASNLGTVELTVSLYKSFDFPYNDVLVWDTGHQSYTHKIISGRYSEFDTLRQKDGICGYANIFESDFDSFGAGHVGTSIGAALAFEQSKRLRNENGNVIAVIGDGALTSGNALEALNQATNLKSNIRIVINDNGMSISPNVGSMASNLAVMRTSKPYTKFKNKLKHFFSETHMNRLEGFLKRFRNSIKNSLIPQNMFEAMGFKYLGPINGHDIELMNHVFNNLKSDYNKPVIIHIHTKKGKGMDYAEKQPTVYHGVGRMNPGNGELITKKNMISYSEALGITLSELGKKDEKLVAITAAMEYGTGLYRFRQKFPERFFDLGITEQFCATFAGGLARNGLHPVYAVYSTFSQRAYDQFVHDIALQKLPVLICLDRAGIVGADGPTHHGNFDINFALPIPDTKIYSPGSIREFSTILNFMVNHNWNFSGPVFLRYPRKSEFGNEELIKELIENNIELDPENWQIISKNEIRNLHGKSTDKNEIPEIIIFATGNMVEKIKNIRGNERYEITSINCTSLKPFDFNLLDRLFKDRKKKTYMITVEEGNLIGGFGQYLTNHIPVSYTHLTLPTN